MAPAKNKPTDANAFNTKEAPTFYPTEEEWQDPTAFLWKIRKEGMR